MTFSVRLKYLEGSEQKDEEYDSIRNFNNFLEQMYYLNRQTEFFYIDQGSFTVDLLRKLRNKIITGKVDPDPDLDDKSPYLKFGRRGYQRAEDCLDGLRRVVFDSQVEIPQEALKYIDHIHKHTHRNYLRNWELAQYINKNAEKTRFSRNRIISSVFSFISSGTGIAGIFSEEPLLLLVSFIICLLGFLVKALNIQALRRNSTRWRAYFFGVSYGENDKGCSPGDFKKNIQQENTLCCVHRMTAIPALAGIGLLYGFNVKEGDIRAKGFNTASIVEALSILAPLTQETVASIFEDRVNTSSNSLQDLAHLESLEIVSLDAIDRPLDKIGMQGGLEEFFGLEDPQSHMRVIDVRYQEDSGSNEAEKQIMGRDTDSDSLSLEYEASGGDELTEKVAQDSSSDVSSSSTLTSSSNT